MIFAFYRLRHIFTFWRGKPCLGSCCVRLLFSKSFACYYYFTLPSFLLPRFSFICPFWFGFIFTVARPAAFINNSHLYLSFPLALMLMSSQLVTQIRFVFPSIRNVRNRQETPSREYCLRRGHGKVIEAVMHISLCSATTPGASSKGDCKFMPFVQSETDFPRGYYKYVEFQGKRH